MTLSSVFIEQVVADGGVVHASGELPSAWTTLFIFARASEPPLKNGSRTLPFGFHSRRAAALRLSSESVVIVRLVSVKSTERLTATHDGSGVAVGEAGAPRLAQGGGEGGTETLVARSSQLPATTAPVSKCERGSEKPLSFSAEKMPAGAASPEGERILLRRCRERGTERGFPARFE